MTELQGKRKTLEELCELMELPLNAIKGVAKITIVGNSQVLVENHGGIVEYGDNSMRLNLGRGRLHICGGSITLKAISGSDLLINGKLDMVEWE